MKRTYLNNAEAQNKGVRANILYGNILDQQRYFFVLPHVRNKKILDCACGVGWGSYVMSMSGAEKITSFDISQNAISAASKYYSRPNIKYICSDFLNPTYDFEKVDIITSFETLEHLDNPKNFLLKLKEVSHSKSILFLSTPNGRTFKPSLDHAPHNPFHVEEYSKEQLLKMFAESGWMVEQHLGQHSMPIDSPEMANYEKFIRDYWDVFTRTKNSYLWRIYYLFLRKLTKFETIEPAHKGNCYPVPVTSGMEPAYHYFILKPISD